MLLSSMHIFAQSYNMSDATISTCSGTFYDSGGSGSDYSNSENKTMVFTSDNGNRLSFNFQSFRTESSRDVLRIYDGPDNTYPLIGAYSGTNSPGVVVSVGTSLTFVFESDYSTTYSGWSALISCTTPALTEYKMSSGTVTTCSGVFTDSGGPNGNYSNNEDKTMTFCSGGSDFVTVSFMKYGFSLASGDTLFAYDGPDASYPIIGAYCGNSLPEDISSQTGSCITFRFKSDLTNVSSGWRALLGCSSTPLINGDFKMMSGIRYTCGGTFYDSGGSSGNYKNDEENTMTFVSHDNKRLKFDFQSFSTESADKLYIYDGPTVNYPLIGVYSGSTSPGIVQSTGNSLTFKFKSDNSVVSSGWAAAISCTTPVLPVYNLIDGTTNNTCEGVFYDSGGPDANYMHNDNKEMTFCSDNGEFIYFTFKRNNFKIHPSDTLYVYDGSSVSAPPIGVYTGDRLPEIISSQTGSCLTFKFVSNAVNNDIGWQALIKCDTVPNTNPQYRIQNGVRYTCGGMFYDSGGPNFNYANSENYTETFISSSGNRLKFDFQVFDTESADKLYIYDGPTVNYPLIGVYSGSTAPGIIESTGNSLTFVFISDGSVVSSGWAAAISCTTPVLPVYNLSNTTVNTCEGVFYDSGGPDANYLHNDNKEMTLCSDNSDFIYVTFQPNNFKIHSSDTLFVYDGDNSSAPPIGVYSGSRLPEIISSQTGSCLTFKFKSNNVNNDIGWKALIKCDTIPNTNPQYRMQNGVRYTCGGKFYDSGGPNGNYANGSNIVETFFSSSGSRLRCDFTSFELENGRDYLIVHDGPTTDYPIIARLTGSGVPYVESTGTSLTFNFISDGSINKAGWKADFSCTTAPLPTYNLSDETIKTCEAVFYDNGGPAGKYPNNDSKTMTFCSEDSTFVKVNFTKESFKIHSSDVLKIYDGPSTASKLIAIVNGYNIPETITSITGSCLTFQFISDATNVDDGWQAMISCVDDPIIRTNYRISQGGVRYLCEANFYDTGGPSGKYGTNEDKTMTFCSNNDCSITAEFNEFDVEANYDKLYVYDGMSVSSTLLYTCSGNDYPQSLTSTNQCLTFKFTSDNSGVKDGWNIALTCNKASIAALPSAVACEGDTVTLTANEGVSYLWSTGETTQSISVNKQGYYSVTVVNENGCNLVSDPLFVKYNPVVKPTITPNGTLLVCPGESVNLISSEGASYLWSNDATGQSTNVVTPGSYWVSVTDENGCTGVSDTVTIQNYTVVKPTITLSGDISICYGDSIEVSTTASNVVWSNGSSNSSIYAEEGTYYLVATDGNGCKSNSDTLIVSYYNPSPPTITPSEQQSICEGSTVVLTSSSGIAYSWSNGGTAQSISVDETGSYFVTVTDENNCSRPSAPVLVNVYPLPPTPTITENAGLLQASPSSGYTFKWYLNGNLISGASSSFYLPTQNGVYMVEIFDNNDCSSVSAPYNFQSFGIEEFAQGFSKLYPNPFATKSKLLINMSKPAYVNIECIDIIGKKVSSIYQGSLPSGIVEIEIDAQKLGLAPGTYILNVLCDDELMQHKMVIN